MECLRIYQSPYPKVRMGTPNDDGGYAVCLLPGEYDALLSGGVANNIQFEEDFLSQYPSTQACFAFDGTVNTFPTTRFPIQFVPLNCGAETTETSSNFHEYLQNYQNAFVKLDIEGHEFRMIPTWIDTYMSRIKQLVLEIHTPVEIQKSPDACPGLSDIKYEDMFRLLEGINKTHTLVHLHGNNGCGIHTYEECIVPNVFECTFIRNDFLSEHIPNKDPIPSPLDVRNHSWYPEIELRGWPYIS
jgi:hypothetical protein